MSELVWVVTCFVQGDESSPTLPLGVVSSEEAAKNLGVACYQETFNMLDDLDKFEAWCELYKVDDNARLVHKIWRGTPETSDELIWEEY